MNGRPQRPSLRLQATARHEAGHAYAAWRLGRGVGDATIVLTETTWGSCAHWFAEDVRPDIDNSPEADTWIEGEVVIAFAGHEAEARFRKEKGMHAAAGSSWAGDLHRAADCALYANGSAEATGTYLDRGRVATRQIIDAGWRQIERLAQRLLEKGTITGDEVTERLDRAQRQGRMGMPNRLGSGMGQTGARRPRNARKNEDR